MAKLWSDITEDGGNKELVSGSRLINLSASFIGSGFGAPDVALYVSGIWGHPQKVYVGHTGSELCFLPSSLFDVNLPAVTPFRQEFLTRSCDVD